MLQKNLVNRSIILSLCCVMVFLLGCGRDAFIKNNISGPIISDSLTDGTTSGEVDNGTFTPKGWMPNLDGRLIYDIPGMTQGKISFDVVGLERIDNNSTFVTIYEPSTLGEYADPYILFNPFRVTLTIKSFDNDPDSTFDFLWTLKNFPSLMEEIDRYVEGIPDNAEGYVGVVQTPNIPIYPDQTYTITILWQHGKSELWLDDQRIAQHDYRPYIFNPRSLRVVFGKSLGMSNLDLPMLAISNVKISFPKM